MAEENAQNLAALLNALGVQVGARNVTPAKTPALQPLEKVLPGEVVTTPFGETYVIHHIHPLDQPVGKTSLVYTHHPHLFSAWADAPELLDLHLQDLAFIDIETTGLSGSAGTYAFLIGFAALEDGAMHVRQYFLRDPSEESAQMYAFLQAVSNFRGLVTFNGRAFDIPILANRLVINGFQPPFAPMLHLDLLLLARRLWKWRLPSRTLLNLEVAILGAERTEEDVPGWVIPQLYLDYLHTADATLLRSVVYHNRLDVLAMSGLLAHMSGLLEAPLDRPETPALDLLGIAQLYERIGMLPEACLAFQRAIESDLEHEAYWMAIRKLGGLHKQLGEWPQALIRWQQAAAAGYVEACVELAKYYEHREPTLDSALDWTITGLQNLRYVANPATWRKDLLHRQERLQRKLAKQNGSAAEMDD